MSEEAHGPKSGHRFQPWPFGLARAPLDSGFDSESIWPGPSQCSGLCAEMVEGEMEVDTIWRKSLHYTRSTFISQWPFRLSEHLGYLHWFSGFPILALLRGLIRPKDGSMKTGKYSNIEIYMIVYKMKNMKYMRTYMID